MVNGDWGNGGGACGELGGGERGIEWYFLGIQWYAVGTAGRKIWQIMLWGMGVEWRFGGGNGVLLELEEGRFGEIFCFLGGFGKRIGVFAAVWGFCGGIIRRVW